MKPEDHYLYTGPLPDRADEEDPQRLLLPSHRP